MKNEESVGIMKYKYLDKINSPSDLKALERDKIGELCAEIRDFLIENVGETGGHLASNLGVVELSVALHRVFDSPRDHIIFDVGHQSYVHKLLTGRREAFSDLRKSGGLSGFTSRRESEHDPFGAGHSSTSVSAALGFAESDALLGRDSYSIAVLGDGAYTGGMVHEALNNCNPDSRLIIILNENGMSISVNKGRFAGYLSRVRFSKGYRVWKSGTTSVIKSIPFLGRPLVSIISFIKKKLKNALFSSNYFEDLGLYYIGPIDGNNYKKTEAALRGAKSLGKCVILHIKTTKGKGYLPAEKSPDDFHSVYSETKKASKTFHEIFRDKLIAMAKDDSSVLAITAAMGIGTGLAEFEKAYPERYFDVGIAEEHALTFSAGLAANGMKPYAAIYSTFIQRSYDNLIHDVALQGLPVRLIIDRAGLAVSDGATHHGIFDVAFLSHIPGFAIYAPVTEGSLNKALEESRSSQMPIAIRYPNLAPDPEVKEHFYSNGNYSEIFFKTDFVPGCKSVFITYGSIITRVMRAAELLSSRGGDVGIILIEKLTPYKDIAREILKYVSPAQRVLFVEEGIKRGGAGASVREELLDLGFDFGKCHFDIAAIDDNFAAPTEKCDLYSYLGLDPESLASRMENL